MNRREYILKTSLATSQDLLQLSRFLDCVSPTVDWYVDLEDCDKVLRVESNELDMEEIIEIVQYAGFEAEELWV